jgi:hypothetical protein
MRTTESLHISPRNSDAFEVFGSFCFFPGRRSYDDLGVASAPDSSALQSACVVHKSTAMALSGPRHRFQFIPDTWVISVDSVTA